MKNLFIYLSDSIEQDLLANFVYCNDFCIFNYNNYIVFALIPIYIQPKKRYNRFRFVKSYFYNQPIINAWSTTNNRHKRPVFALDKFVDGIFEDG
jgi:hypothetical protein